MYLLHSETLFTQQLFFAASPNSIKLGESLARTFKAGKN